MSIETIIADEQVEQATADWKTGAFPTIPGDASEFIPLPEE